MNREIGNYTKKKTTEFVCQVKETKSIAKRLTKTPSPTHPSCLDSFLNKSEHTIDGKKYPEAKVTS